MPAPLHIDDSAEAIAVFQRNDRIFIGLPQKALIVGRIGHKGGIRRAGNRELLLDLGACRAVRIGIVYGLILQITYVVIVQHCFLWNIY